MMETSTSINGPSADANAAVLPQRALTADQQKAIRAECVKFGVTDPSIQETIVMQVGQRIFHTQEAFEKAVTDVMLPYLYEIQSEHEKE